MLGKQGEYAELLGRESDTNAQIRTKGFHAILDAIPALKRVAAQSANWSQAEAFQKTETMLQAHGSINGIIAGNDTMALGAVAAVASAGLKNIQIVGFDGSPDAIAAIRAGDLQATALQPAVYIAKLAVDEADRFLKTGTTGQAERQIIPCDLVTRENANDYGNFEKTKVNKVAPSFGPRKMTLGVVVGNRDFFPDALITEARRDLIKLFTELDITPIWLTPEESKLGAVETWPDAVRCGELFRKHRESIDGILVCLPNFGDEKGVADSIRLSELQLPVLVQACPTISTNLAWNAGAMPSAEKSLPATTFASMASITA